MEPEISSDEELFDVDWSNEQADQTFSYTDPLTLSPLAAAVVQNDIKRIKNLLKEGRSININDNAGNTPLHIAVMTKSKASFDFLLTLEDIRLDVQNFQNETPLILATKSDDSSDYYALNLIKRGADLEITDNYLQTALHYAACCSKTITQALIDFGADVNAYSPDYGTPLLKAVVRQKFEISYMLVLNGAAPHICASNGNSGFTESLKLNVPPEFKEFLFDCTFEAHEKQPVDLSIYTKLICSIGNQNILDRIYRVTSEIIWNDDDLSYFKTHVIDMITYLNFERFTKFFETFPDFFKHYFSTPHNFIFDYVSHVEMFPRKSKYLVDFLFLILNSPVIGDIVESSTQLSGVISKIVKIFKASPNLESERLPELIFGLLSHGFELNIEDLCTVYETHGNESDLFRTLLLFPNDPTHNAEMFVHNILPVFMTVINMELSIVLHVIQYLSPKSVEICLDFFAHRDLRELAMSIHKDDEKTLELETVPSLVEIARTKTRRYLIKRFNLKNSWMFYERLQRLPISQVYKDIIGYQRKIYRI